MYINNIKKEFYDFLVGKHVVIIVHHDIDAICTFSVKGLRDLKVAYNENFRQVKCFILINCGGTIDLVEELDPPEDVIFFVLDSHRPTDVCNIYSDRQIRLLWHSEEDQNVPEFDDIFRDDEIAEEIEDDGNSESENEAESESKESKRRRMGEEEIIKRRERRLWEENRNKLMFEYTQYSYYAKASAITMFELSRTLAKDTKEILWLTILSLTEQYLLGKIESSQYTIFSGNLQLEVARVVRRQGNVETSNLTLSSEQDLKVWLYRHWSVERSLICSLYTACKMKLWSLKGERHLQELLVEMGLPLVQSRQKFSAMELTYRQEFPHKLETCGAKFGLDDLVFPSFAIRYGYRGRYAASDIVFTLLALLEHTTRTHGTEACFSDTLDCIAQPPPEQLLKNGLEHAKLNLDACLRVMKAALDQRKIFSTGPFLYYILHESVADSMIFSHPHSLLLLGRYLQTGYCERHRNRASAAAMPLLVSAPIHLFKDHNSEEEEQEQMSLILGLPPLCENSPKNFFGKAFEQAAEKSNSEGSLDFFDTSYILLRIVDRPRFLDSLTALLS